jgi:hypothetical protein
MQVGFTLLHNTKYSPLTRLSKVGVHYKAIRFAPTMKCPWIRYSNKELSKKIVLTHKQPATGTPYPQVSQVSSKISLSLGKKTKITAFNGDYHQPAAPKRYATVEADLRVVIWLTDLAISK